MEGESSFLPRPEKQCRCFVNSVAEILSSSEEPEENNNRTFLLLSTMCNCLISLEHSKILTNVSFPDTFHPDDLEFCSKCENYLVEFEQLTQQIHVAQRRLNTVRYTIVAKFLSVPESAGDLNGRTSLVSSPTLLSQSGRS